MTRSYGPLTKEDLKRLVEIAARDRADLFQRKPETGRLYGERLFAVALCQGSALHYLDGKNGVKDLDIWSFFRPSPERPFPYRRRAQLDFGDPKFGSGFCACDRTSRRNQFVVWSRATKNKRRDCSAAILLGRLPWPDFLMLQWWHAPRSC
jgi:hypothetical protein